MFLRCLTLPAFFIATSLVAQQSTRVNSSLILKQGAELHEQKKYREEIALYNKVSRADTNYSQVLSSLVFAHYTDSNYNEAVRLLQQAIKLYPESNDNWYNLLANSYDNMDRTEEAIAYYDKIIATYENAYLPWYNKGITYYNQKKYDESKQCFYRSLAINPYYAATHHFLANVAYFEGDLVSAMLGYTANLVILPENMYSGSSITMLSNISKGTDEVIEKVTSRKARLNENFELIQELLLSKVALDKQYKLKASLDDAITRQLQVLLEKLEYVPADKSFTMQYYVPFFANINKEQVF